MPTLQLISKYKKNTGLIMSPSELKDLYLYGFTPKSDDGSDFPDESYRFYIKAAQDEIERFLSIKFQFQLFEDSDSYHRDDYFNNFPIIKTRYPVAEPLSLNGFYKKIEQISYPKEWLSSSTNSDGAYMKRISIVPTSGSVVGTSQDMIYTGVTTAYGSLRGYNMLPDYWRYQYTTGYCSDNVPMELVNAVGKLASIGVLNIIGDLLLGAGIASQSLSIDGLSQSISSTSSATNSGMGARIIQYQKEVKDTLSKVKNQYKGISFTVL